MEPKPVVFQFAKTVKKSNVLQTPLNSAEKVEEVEFVKSVDDTGIESTRKRKEAAILVIPLKKPRTNPAHNEENKSSLDSAKIDHAKSLEETSLDMKAAEELLKETADGAQSGADNKEVEDIEVHSNALVQGATIGEVPTLSDYHDVPVSEFGKALLRGMGWKDGDGTGKNGETVAPFEAVVRPKGLGLGATTTTAQASKPADGEEELQMVPGAFVVVTIGKEKGCYGQVASLDGEGRALVKMAVSGSTSSLPESTLQLVTRKDYKRNSRVLNQDKYNEYREKQEKEHKASVAPETGSRHSKDRDRGHSAKRRTDARSKDASSRSEKPAGAAAPADTAPWVRPQLRVRCIDQSYKKGRYFKEKLTVVDVITRELCVCEDAAGRLLEDVSTARLETVVPRHRPAHVMVLRGQHRAQVGEVIERDQRRCRATVQLLPDRQLCTLGYDDICEYTGSMEAYS
ncbi:G-patch domain and KOW motifs-containing protein-like [Pollicipes pollicipes]|uniref:G-patch domain and KOW motifs-containing protein-like n=1 Tax=Pollicipes pollicipes TaxID=41117 RepID=UPI00188509F3|nr:G-patch domain and KOW motifs-containing protein-like [Pollicipes pollicipes]